MFIDEVTIKVIAGRAGTGGEFPSREFVPMGGPDMATAAAEISI